MMSVESSTDIFLSPQKIKLAAQNPFWKGLLYYESGLFGQSSLITSKRFFLASDGDENPESELLASLQAFYAPLTVDDNNHAICKFPARLKWLKSQKLVKLPQLPKPTCLRLNEWHHPNKYQSISLVFATGYLENPASYFGHLFLKFNQHPPESEQNLLNYAVNFGADISSKDNAIVYALKGLFGGYDSFYSQNDFYSHHFNYGNTELRDLWEYELNLNQEDQEYLSLRMWELFAELFDYYFLNENCAYFIVNPLEKQIGQKLLPSYVPFSLPKHAIEGLEEIKIYANTPLVKQTIYIPSKQSVFYKKYAQLNSHLKTPLNHLIHQSTTNLNDKQFKDLAQNDKTQILEILLDYLSYKYAGKSSDSLYQKNRKTILVERFALPPNMNQNSKKPVQPTPPSQSQRVSLMSIGSHYVENESDPTFNLRIRPASHDLLSSPIGRPDNSSLSVFDLKLSARHQKLWVDYFDLVKITALNTSPTGLWEDSDFAWRMKVGFGPQFLNSDSQRHYHLLSQVGYALSDQYFHFIPYVLTGLQVQNKINQSGYGVSNSELGLLLNTTQYFSLKAILGYKYWLDGSYEARPNAGLEIKVSAHRFFDMRFNYQYEDLSKYSMNIGTYW